MRMPESPHFPKRYPVPTIGTGPVHGEETVILDPAPSSGQGSEPQGPERPGSVRGKRATKGAITRPTLKATKARLRRHMRLRCSIRTVAAADSKSKRVIPAETTVPSEALSCCPSDTLYPWCFEKFRSRSPACSSVAIRLQKANRTRDRLDSAVE